MHHGLFLHVIHVAGTWMRQQGTDGLSRSWLDTGVLSGTDMLSFVPLHMSALDLQASLARWVHLWFLDLCCLDSALTNSSVVEDIGELCDLLFCVPLGSDIWPQHLVEPLFVGIYLFT